MRKKNTKKIFFIYIMKIIYFFFGLASCKLIKNLDINSCRNCIYYIPDNHLILSKCEYFGNKNIIDNTIYNDYAEECRKDENKCGLQGKYFKENKFADIQILTHNIISNDYLLILPLIFLAYISYLIKISE